MEVSVGIMETSEVEIRFNGTYTSSYGGILSGVHVFNMQNMNNDQIIFSPESFKGNKVKLQLADYQLTAIFFCQIRTTFAQQNLKIRLKIHCRSSLFNDKNRFHNF